MKIYFIKRTIALLMVSGLVNASGFAQQSNAFQDMLRQIDEAIVAPKEVESVVTPHPVPAIDTLVIVKHAPVIWKIGSLNSLNFSQMALSNWAAGGQGSVAMNAYIDMFAIREQGKHLWENRLQVAYGFIQPFGEQYKKSDDKLILDSKWGWRAYDHLFLSAALSFLTQMTPGFDYPKNAEPIMVSKFMTPGYISFGLGIDYKPYPFLSLGFSPLTSKLVIVDDPDLRTKYGNKVDEAVRVELGTQVLISFKKEVFKNVAVATELMLFSDYLGVLENIKVKWDLVIDMKVNKFLSANLRTNMIYDDNIMITDANGNVGPRLQIKEIFGIGLTYSFGKK